jgi:arylsulfatase A
VAGSFHEVRHSLAKGKSNMNGSRRKQTLASAGLLALCGLMIPGPAPALADPPNIVIIFCDDLGYGDLSCYGHPTLHTPNLDRMAAEGVRFTQFYSAAEVCTPSRAALLTGRLPIRNGMCSSQRRVLFGNSQGGLPAHEITLAEVLKQQGYATACIGKWHLGHLPEYLPTQNGFDYYFGVPYSNDMDRVADAPAGRKAFDDPRIEYWNVPLMRNESIIERPAEQTTLTRRYTDETIQFIREHQTHPFFIYLAHTMPHVPLFRSGEFEGRSRRGLYGDVVEEIDAGVGKILDTLRSTGLDQNTMVFFTSDNGPWLIFQEQGGSAGLLKDGKGSTWEGGMREPALAWWPGRIPGGRLVHDLGCTMDLFVTVHSLLEPFARAAGYRPLAPRSHVLLSRRAIDGRAEGIVENALVDASGLRRTQGDGTRPAVAVSPGPRSGGTVRISSRASAGYCRTSKPGRRTSGGLGAS